MARVEDETLSRKRWEASIQERTFIPNSTYISSTQLRRPKKLIPLRNMAMKIGELKMV